MRYIRGVRGALFIVACAGCSFSSQSSTAPDGGPHAEIVDETATDFSGTLSGGVVAPRGALEPDTYVMGGLHAQGWRNNTNPISKTTSLDALPPLGTNTGEIYGLLPNQSWPGSGPTFPKGLGINQGDNFALQFDGEIFLPAGMTILELLADDAAVFEINAGTATTIAAATSDLVPVAVPIMAPAAGWYPIRGVMGEGGGDARVLLGTGVDSNGSPTLDGKLLRAKTTTVHGLVMAVFAGSELESGPGLGFDPGPLDHANLLPGPSDYGFNGVFSIRYEGQLLVDQSGDYDLSVDVGPDLDDGYRVFVDGTLYSQQWLAMPTVANLPLRLTAGWHAIVIDYGDNSGNASIHLSLASTTDSEFAPVAADHLRPVVTEGITPGAGAKAVTVFGAMPAIDYPIALLPPSGATVDYADFAYVLTGPRGHLMATLSAASVSQPLAIEPAPNETEGAQYDYVPLQTAFHGFPAQTTWHLQLADSQASENPQMSFEVIASHHGGVLMPFSPALDYVSVVHELINATAIGAIRVMGSLAGTTLKVQVHTSDDLDAIAAEPWVDVANGAIPAVELHRYVQYHLQISDDGWAFPVVDQVAIDFAQ
jgi:hypothetical protein